MSVQIIHDKEDGYKCLMCNTSMVVFGPVFHDDEDVVAFLEWLPKDARLYKDNELIAKRLYWLSEQEESK